MKTGWYVLLDGKEIGPMPAKDIRSAIEKGEMPANIKVRIHPDASWRSAEEVGILDSVPGATVARGLTLTYEQKETIGGYLAIISVIGAVVLGCGV